MNFVLEMSAEVRISYIYASDETWSKFEQACDRLGWQSKALIQQIIHSFFAKHKDFYCQAALADAEARGMQEQDYYVALKSGPDADLSPYKKHRPDFGSTPLAIIPDPEASKENRRRYNMVTLSDFNYVLLHSAMLVERANPVEIVSRIVAWHFIEYWERSYLPQIRHDDEHRFVLEGNT